MTINLTGNYRYNSKKEEYKPAFKSNIYSIRRGQARQDILFINYLNYHTDTVTVYDAGDSLKFTYKDTDYTIIQNGKTVAKISRKEAKA